jgi:hypothetical protein
MIGDQRVRESRLKQEAPVADSSEELLVFSFTSRSGWLDLSANGMANAGFSTLKSWHRR